MPVLLLHPAVPGLMWFTDRMRFFIYYNGRIFCCGDHIYKKIELVGSSPKGIQEAVENALSRASQTIRNMRWFEVMDTRGQIEDGRVNHWQVTLKVGFTLDS